jgi:hypothetical protein
MTFSKYASRFRPKRSGQNDKMGNKPTVCALGHSHRSMLEGSVCQILQLRERAGELKLIQVEDHVLISGWYRYVPDFKCQDTTTGEFFWVEAKGFANDRWPSTRRGWIHAGPGKLEVWKGTHRNPKLDEVIIPKTKKESIDE